MENLSTCGGGVGNAKPKYPPDANVEVLVIQLYIGPNHKIIKSRCSTIQISI